MKLNPAKCTFDVEEGKFLGYYVTNNGILSHPTKVNDLLVMEKPNNLKDAQGLNRKITALGRFIRKSVDANIQNIKRMCRQEQLRMEK